MSGLIKWIGGIVSAVLIAVLIKWLTDSTPSQQTAYVEGYVLDSSSNALANVPVKAQCAGSSEMDQTDVQGRFLFAVPSQNVCHLTISAKGYEPDPYILTIQSSGNAPPLRVPLRKTPAPIGALTPGMIRTMPLPLTYQRRSRAVPFPGVTKKANRGF